MTLASETNEDFRILALDGGGTRGIYGAQVLAKIEEYLGVEVRECFDLIVGASTGSIIAGAAAAGIPMQEVVSLFENDSPRIFKKTPMLTKASMFLFSRYSMKPLADVLETRLGAITLGDVSVPLMIPSADISTDGVHVFKSRFLNELGGSYTRDGDVLLKDAILASCAAPTYFDPQPVGPYLLVDGGLWANNPSIIALTEAMSKFNKQPHQVKVLSIGTGHTKNMYTKGRHWGLLTRWGRDKLISYTLGIQSQASRNMAKLILKDGYLRLDPEIDTWELDDTKCLGNLKALADRDFTHLSEAILNHLRKPGT